LPDGRVICIGGEHEDHYDPDFAIYNDVIVISPDGADVTIYGYPRDVFPPTDFHTSTLAGNRIIVIGGLGYPDERGGPVTPVFELDLNTFSMSRLATSGNAPGWIFDHRATLSDDGNAMLVWGGKRQPERGRQGRFAPNEAAYRLSLCDLRWSEVARPSEKERLDIEWPDTWEAAETKDDRSYEMSCLLQAAPLGHPLFAAPLLPVVSSYMGRALFKLLDGTERYAAVELHGPATRHESAPAPLTVFYNSIEDWLAAERAAH
jgi:hypothetical protein